MRGWLVLTAMSFLLASSQVAQAVTDANSLAKDFEATKKNLEDAEVKQRKILSALYQINKKIKRIVTDKGDLFQQKAFLEIGIESLNRKVRELEESAQGQRTILAERLRAIYKLGSGSVARFLVTSKNSASLESNLKILGIVATRDLELIRNYTHDAEDLKKKKSLLSSKLESLKAIEGKILAQEKELRSEQEVKNKILDGIRKSKRFALDKINGLREKSLQINIEDTGLFDVLFKPSFADHKGVLPPPLQGVIIQKFGLMKGQEHPYTISHKGIFISAAKGSPIKSIFEGTVSYVGEVPGFGTTLIVDHGDHFYSVYSQTQDVKVKRGDEISQAQVLAQVGEPLQESTPGLYFEIRHFSEPYDPQQWMKGL